VPEHYERYSSEAFLPFDGLLLYLVNSNSRMISCSYLISPSCTHTSENPAGLTSLLRSNHLLPIANSQYGSSTALKRSLVEVRFRLLLQKFGLYHLLERETHRAFPNQR
jgi:hypothetical protein